MEHDLKIMTELIWPKTRSSWKLSCRWNRNFGLQRGMDVFWPAQQLLDSQWLCFMEYVKKRTEL